jgi:hypothetical protein
MAGPMLELAEIDRQLHALRAATTELGATLFDLDALPLRTMLNPAALRGTTLHVAERVLAALTNAWERYPALTELLDGCERLRGTVGAHVGTREREQLCAMLQTKNADGRTPMEVVTDLVDGLVGLRAQIDRIDAAWRSMIPRVGDLATRAARVQDMATELGEDSAALTQLHRRVVDLRDLVTADPLGADDRTFAALGTSVAALEQELQSLRTKRDALATEIAGMTAHIDVLRGRIADGIAAAQRVRARIAAPGGPTPTPKLTPLSLDLIDGPGGFRPRARAIATSNATPAPDWRRAVRDVESWTRDFAACLQSATTVRDANVALMARRDQLRGRFDALKVKAARTGRAELDDVAVAQEAATTALQTAPVDLDAAEVLVARYAAMVGDGARQQTESR